MSDLIKLLVVDDDRIQCAIIEEIGKRSGMTVTSVSTFEDALHCLDTETFAWITVDLSLGEHNGIELLARIAKISPVPRVIVISACDRRILSATSRMASDLGLGDVVAIEKPIDLSMLKAAFRSFKQKPSKPSETKTAKVNPQDLERALAVGEIKVAFQPKVCLHDGSVVGCEALARWRSPSLGNVPPDQFIACAEANNLVGSLTRTIMDQALAFAGKMLTRDPDFVTAINLSAQSLNDLTILDDIQHAIDIYQIPARNVVFEVTETTAMSEAPVAAEVLLQMRLKGFGVSIDDFGTGYSSLAILSRMPFTELKIDMSFVRQCLKDPAMLEIVRSSVELAHQLDMKVVAEGIETAEIAEALTEMSCDTGQGYLYSPPIADTAFIDYYDSRVGNRDIRRVLVA